MTSDGGEYSPIHLSLVVRLDLAGLRRLQVQKRQAGGRQKLRSESAVKFRAAVAGATWRQTPGTRRRLGTLVLSIGRRPHTL